MAVSRKNIYQLQATSSSSRTLMLAYQIKKELGRRWADLDMQVSEGSHASTPTVQ